MHIIIATIKAALGCHVTDLIDIFINVSMQYLIETEGVYVWQSLVKIAASYNTKTVKLGSAATVCQLLPLPLISSDQPTTI